MRPCSPTTLPGSSTPFDTLSTAGAPERSTRLSHEAGSSPAQRGAPVEEQRVAAARLDGHALPRARRPLRAADALLHRRRWEHGLPALLRRGPARRRGRSAAVIGASRPAAACAGGSNGAGGHAASPPWNDAAPARPFERSITPQQPPLMQEKRPRGGKLAATGGQGPPGQAGARGAQWVTSVSSPRRAHGSITVTEPERR